MHDKRIMFSPGEGEKWRTLRDRHPGIELKSTDDGFALHYKGAVLAGEYLGDLLQLALYGSIEDVTPHPTSLNGYQAKRS